MGMILLYYKYIELSNLEELQAWQRALCTSLELRGRIILAKEGINGTVGGSIEAAKEYIKAMEKHALFSDVEYKTSEGDENDFPSLYIGVRAEIVSLGIDPELLPASDAGTYLAPHEAHEFLNNKDENTVVLDCRNDYETRIGTFEGSLRPPISRFRDFPEYVDNNLHLFEGKKVIMGCTGGVRCVRASAYLKKKGIEEVYHIQGGIHCYAEEFPNGHFKGKNYVFDDRIALKITDDILTTCDHCSVAYDAYTNCSNTKCNEQIILCPECDSSWSRTCSKECKDLVVSGTVKMRTKYKQPVNVEVVVK